MTPLLYRKHFPFLFQILFRRLSAEEDYEPSEEVRLRMMTLLGALLAETGELSLVGLSGGHNTRL